MSPRTPKQYKVMREEKKTLIMDAALKHFATGGFHATSISHIAKHAGISKGLLYNYFNSKDELLSEIVNRSISDIYLSFDTNRDGYLSEEEFEHFIRKMFSILKENKQFWKLLFGITLQKGVYGKLLEMRIKNMGTEKLTIKDIIENMSSQLINYFMRKRPAENSGNDPETDLLLFFNTVKGFALTIIFVEDLYPDDVYEKTIDAIVKTYR